MELSVSMVGLWSLGWGVAGLLLLACAVRALNWAWWRPRQQERLLRAQGLQGTPYRFIRGDIKEDWRLLAEARSKPIPLSHHIIPRVAPFLRTAMNEFGKCSRPPVSLSLFCFANSLCFSKLFDTITSGLISYHGGKWAKHRRILNPAFHVEKLKNNRIKAINREVRSILRGIIKERQEATGTREATNNDLLGLLMESNLQHLQEHGNKNAGMTSDEVVEECKLFYFAGQETVSVLLTWTMVVLSMHPEWQVKAREEVLQVFGKNKPDFDGLSRLKIVSIVPASNLKSTLPNVCL
ncbi:hypothetical protein B296_00057360 [Ensete ventricosum]|uniref:Cytochrome P450 n=1 Tax=Ensete ventricosum TaxID=4639 RepID=A0A426XCA8_ENSVE|nr:hypothetical protein B296_00057360 [Ensete ventricosum]